MWVAACRQLTSIMVFDPKIKNRAHKLLALAFWLLIWQAAAWAIGQEILLVGPLETIEVLLRLLVQPGFWARVVYSVSRICLGFLLALAVGVILAAAGASSRVLHSLIAVPMQLIKAAPVASFIILALMWVRSNWLSVLISFLIGVPVVYTAVLQGIHSTDIQLLEMARVFRLPLMRTLRAVWIPQIMPYFAQSASTALGLCIKSGVAAEVIGLPPKSLGEALYSAKITLLTGELFAWTLVIIGVAALLEILLKKGLAVLSKQFGWQGEGAQ